MLDYQRLAERAFIANMITKTYPNGIVSLVSDTYDFWAVVSEDMKILKPLVMARDGKVVLRPDSGDPVKIICGNALIITDEILDRDGIDRDLDGATIYANEKEVDNFWYQGKYYGFNQSYITERIEINPTPEMKGAAECLWDIFGGTETSAGYKTLDSHIGLIYGDSINLDRAQRILAGLKAKGFSSANIVFGIGSFTYQFVTRDTYGIAVKATYGVVNGVAREIFKDPKTDDGMKKSAVGLIRVEKEGDDYVMYDRQTWEQEAQGELRTIFEDSQMIVDEKYTDIKQRLHTA